MHLRRFTPVRALVLFALLLGWPVLPATAQPVSNDSLVREYFVRQEAEQPLVIRVNPFEAEFQVRVTGPNGEPLRQSELPGNRTQPVFLYIDGAPRERQLDIIVEAPLFTRQTRFELEFSRLDVRDSLSEKLARAYQLLSRGQEFLVADTAANWSVKINMLIQSARLFEEFGMEEHRLWAWLAAAHLAHFELGDSNTALDWAGQAIAAARLAALADPAFAGQVLRGEILFQRAERPGAGSDEHEAARTALADTSRIAGLVGNAYEQAWALFLLGEGLAGEGEHELALARYRQALEVAEQRDAVTLAAEIRKRMVAAHETLGDVVAKEQALDTMVEQLAVGGAETELVKGLIAQGQLYLELFRYPDAVAALKQALEIDKTSLTRTHAAILLGRAHYESGRFEEATETLLAALVNPQTGLFRRPNPLLPLAPGLDALAGSYRHRGLHSEAARVRTVLSRHLDTPADGARWARQNVIDELAAGNLRVAAAHYREYGARFRAEPGGAQGALALLALCAEGGGNESCNGAGIEAAMARAESGGPRYVLQARFHHARILAREGRAAQAASEFESLLVDIHFYQTELTGVLGAWYWSNRDEVFRQSLQVLSGSSTASALASFSALARILAIGRVIAHHRGDDALRSEIAHGGSGWQESLQVRFEQFRRANARLSESSIRDWLNGLSEEASVLALLPENGGVHRWLAGRKGIRYRRLPAPPGLANLLAGLVDNPTTSSLERVGSALLGDLAEDLPETVYWLPVGELLGVDLGRLRLEGRRMGSDHNVTALVDFPAALKPVGTLDSDWAERVFLAGDPADWTSTVPERLSVSPEMEAVREQFAGPGLHMVQGNALLPDEFSDSRVRAATLIHLALPARIDLAGPEASRFELSEPGRGAGRRALYPADLRTLDLNARLLVLGQLEFSAGSPGHYDSRLGLVNDLVEAGAGMLMACRPNQGEASADFMRSFYQSLAQGRGVAAAKREAFRDDGLAPQCQLYSP